MEVLLVLSVLILIFIILSFIRHFHIRRQHPPGPFDLPFIGLLPLRVLQILFARFLPKISHGKYFKQMKDKYGDIWSINFGSQRIVGLASMDIINEAFVENGKLFSARPSYESFKIMCKDRGVILTAGELWQSNRQLLIKAMRDLGMGKQLLNTKIAEEVDELIENIEKKLSTPVASPAVFVKSIFNVTNQLAFDERNDNDDAGFEDFIKNLKIIAHSNAAHDVFELFSWILPTKYIRKIFSVVEQFIKSNEECMEFIGDKCRLRMDIEGEFSKPSCVFDFFWRYRYQDDPEVDPLEKFLNISHVMYDIFIAGTDTSTNVLGYSCLMLGHYPDMQEEIRKEIQSLVDDHKLISMDLRKDCPKLLSFIDEVQRYFRVAPFLHHRAFQTCIFRGYKIMDSDVVIGDVSTAMQDPALFGNPDNFDPFRFMDKSRSKYVPNKEFIPFGIGKRSCLGEGIAVIELFLFLSKIIQRFTISLSEDTKSRLSDVIEGTYGVVHAPLDHEIIFNLACKR